MFKKITTRSLLALTALFTPLSANAATITANLSVSAQVGGSCSVGSSGIDFGQYDPVILNSILALPGVGNVDVACTLGTSAVVTLGQGSNAGGGSTNAVPVRRMASGAQRLGYSLYRDLLRTQVWGNTAGTGLAVLGTGLNLPVPVYGSIPAAQNVESGTYTDTVVVTVTF